MHVACAAETAIELGSEAMVARPVLAPRSSKLRVGSTLRSPRTRNATQRMLPYRNAVGRLSAAQTVLTDTRFRSWPLERCEPLTARTLRARPIQVGAAREKLRLSQRGPALRHNAACIRSAQRYASDAHAALRMPRWRSATDRRSTTGSAQRSRYGRCSSHRILGRAGVALQVF